ncbi:MAG: thiolase domain-containing protein [Candidatus Thermoplasmatota archaeon]|nr:thiolase domain-containing protein [Candidatus Thermoplasmatota archaeon]
MRKVAVIGAGMTLFRRRLLETGKEMAFQAAQAALEEAGLGIDQVDAVVTGSAPDAFDGVHMKGEYLLDGAGGVRKPYMRVYTGGGTGCFSPIAGWWHVASGLADVVLVVNEEKMSSITPHPQYAFANIWDPILDRPLNPNLVWIFAMEMNRYMTVYGIEKADIARVAVKNKRNAVDHPAAQLADPNITVDDVLNSEVMAWPVQRLDISPPSDGASALVLASEEVARRVSETPVWISGVGWCIDSTMWTNRDLAFPEYLARAAKQAYGMAKIENPRKEVDVVEPYDPFDYKELHHLEGLLLADKGEAPTLTREGVTQRDGELPTCPSGGLMGVGNPIAATMGIKTGEIYWQLAGKAGRRQVPGSPQVGVCQAWGDLMQFSSVMVMRA